MVKRLEHYTSSQCPVACSLDILGDHWTLLIIRELLFTQNHQYRDLLTIPEGISSNILSDRLKKLEEQEIIASAYRPDNKRDKLYYLTERGKGLIFVILEISRWADQNLGDRILISDDCRPMLDQPPKTVAKQIFKQLAEWEAANVND